MNKFKLWVIRKLLAGRPLIINVDFIGTVAIDHDKNENIIMEDTNVNLAHNEKIPTDTAVYFARNVEYDERHKVKESL